MTQKLMQKREADDVNLATPLKEIELRITIQDALRCYKNRCNRTVIWYVTTHGYDGPYLSCDKHLPRR